MTLGEWLLSFRRRVVPESSASKSAREIILELFDPEDGSTPILRNVWARAKHMTSHPRRLKSSGPNFSFRKKLNFVKI